MSFNTSPSSSLTQPEREAIVDLLHLCLYADAHISIRESDVITSFVEGSGWDMNLSFSSYEPRSIAAARAARSTPEGLKEFIAYAAERLKSPAARERAISACGELIKSDGANDREAQFLAQIRAALK